jgi:hypothetical protein
MDERQGIAWNFETDPKNGAAGLAVFGLSICESLINYTSSFHAASPCTTSRRTLEEFKRALDSNSTTSSAKLLTSSSLISHPSGSKNDMNLGLPIGASTADGSALVGRRWELADLEAAFTIAERDANRERGKDDGIESKAQHMCPNIQQSKCYICCDEIIMLSTEPYFPKHPTSSPKSLHCRKTILIGSPLPIISGLDSISFSRRKCRNSQTKNSRSTSRDLLI